MNKKVSLIIALAMSIGISSTTFAASPTDTSTQNNTNLTQNSTGTINVTLDDALNNLEKSNTTIQLKNQKILLAQRMYDGVQQKATQTANKTPSAVNAGPGGYVSVKMAEDIAPQQANNGIQDAKVDEADTLKNLKVSLEKYYMDAVNCQDQINNINSTIANIDEQIKQTEANISVGTATSDALDSLNVQKSQLIASLNTPQSQMEQDVLNVKQLLNLDLNSNVVLATAKKDFVKYDDSNIDKVISDSAGKNYNMQKANNQMDILKKEDAIYTQYSFNDTSSQINTELSMQDQQSTIDNTKLQNEINLWQAYYTLKNNEDSVSTENVNLQNAQTTYDNTVVKFNAGQVNQVQLDSAKLALDKEKIVYQKAVNTYMVSVDDFNNQLTQ